MCKMHECVQRAGCRTYAPAGSPQLPANSSMEPVEKRAIEVSSRWLEDRQCRDSQAITSWMHLELCRDLGVLHMDSGHKRCNCSSKVGKQCDSEHLKLHFNHQPVHVSINRKKSPNSTNDARSLDRTQAISASTIASKDAASHTGMSQL